MTSMGIIRLTSIIAVVMGCYFTQSVSFASLGSEVDESSGGNDTRPAWMSSQETINSYAPIGSSDGSVGSQCSQGGNIVCMTPETPIPTPRPDYNPATDDQAAKQSGSNGNKSNGGNGTQKSGGTASPCEADYKKYLEECQAAVYTTAEKCDENNNAALAGAAAGAQTAGQTKTDSAQYACGQSGNVSNAAKEAMTSFRQLCNGALTTCRSTCGDYTEYVKKNPTCFKGSGSGVAAMSVATAKAVSESEAARCEPYQAKVDDADKSIQAYAATGAGAAACQQATAGTSTPEEAKAVNEAKAFCEANPTAMGCAALADTNCSDPAQATSNKVCVCAANPTNPMCYAPQSASEGGSVASGSMDSSSRLNSGNDSYGGGDMPNLPNINPGPRGSGGAGEAVDGRQGSSATVGDAGGGSGGGGRPARGDYAAGEEDPAAAGGGGRGGFYGGGSGGRGGGAASGSYGRAGSVRSGGQGAAAANGNPDLRQFLPGGMRDPAMARAVSGSAAREGIDGITGPYSSNWKKMQNRFLLLQPSLLP